VGDEIRETARRTASIFRHRAFVGLWASQGVSELGTQFTGFALPVVAVLLLHAGEWQLGILNAAETIAFLVVGLPAGAWVDRWLKRRTMIVADLVRALAIAAVPILFLCGVLNIWHLVAVATVVGFATVFFDVSYQSYLPILVPEHQVQDGNSKLEATAQVARIAGPAAAGGLVQILSAPLLMIVDSFSYLASAAFLSRVRDLEAETEKAARRPLRAEIAEGVRFVWHQPLIRSVVGTTAGNNLFSAITSTLLPLLALTVLHLGTVGLGVVLSAASVGGLVGAVATPRLARRLGEGPVIVSAAIASALLLTALPLAVLTPSFALPILAVAEFGQLFAVLVYNITQLTLRQRLCPPALLGRMNASIRFVVWGITPFGSLAAGALGSWLGVVPALWIAAAGTLASCAFVAFSPLPRLRSLPST
jgi:MFS family permease